MQGVDISNGSDVLSPNPHMVFAQRKTILGEDDDHARSGTQDKVSPCSVPLETLASTEGYFED